MKTIFRSLIFLGLSILFISPAWAMEQKAMDTSEDERNGRGTKRGADQELTHEDGSPANPAKRARKDTTGNSDAPDKDDTEMTDASNPSEQKNVHDSKDSKDAKTEEKTLKETALTLVPKLIP